VSCSASRVVPGAHRVVGPGTHRGSGPREVHTTVPPAVWASEDAVPPGKSSCCSPPARFGVVEGLVVGNDIPCVHGDHNVHHGVHGMRRSSNDHADHRREGEGKQKE
jgi:hypothetical protein